MNVRIISQKFQPSSDLLLISGSIIDLLIDYRNLTKQIVPDPPKINLNEYSQLMNKINEFPNLKTNWDSYNADAISMNSIKMATEILNYLNTKGLLSIGIKVNVFPMRDGGIQYEFDGENICAELEINQTGVLTFIRFDDDGNIIDKDHFFELSGLSTLLIETQYA